MKKRRDTNTLELRKDSSTVVNWVTDTARCGLGRSCRTGQAQTIMAMVEKGRVQPVDKTAEFAKHNFTAYNKIADTWTSWGTDGAGSWVTEKEGVEEHQVSEEVLRRGC